MANTTQLPDTVNNSVPNENVETSAPSTTATGQVQITSANAEATNNIRSTINVV